MTDDQEDKLLCLMAIKCFELEGVNTPATALQMALSILEEVKKRRQQLGRNK